MRLKLGRSVDAATGAGAGGLRGDLPGTPARSWVDALQERVAALPWPTWLTYLGAWALLVGIEALGRGAAGTGQVGTWPFVLMALAFAPFTLAFMDHLDAAAARAAGRLRLVDGQDPTWLEQRIRELTTMPALGCAVATLLAVGFGLFQRFVFTDPHLGSLGLARSGWLYYFELALMPVLGWAGIGAFVYHAVRQVVLVDRLYRSPEVAVEVFGANLFHAFAGFSARLSVGIMLFSYLWLLAYPKVASPAVAGLNIGIILVIATVGDALFFLPLWGAHHRLAAAKAERLAYCTGLLESVLALQHETVEARRFDQVKALNETATALASEVALVERTSTWPWSPNLFRGFVTAVLLPMLLFLAQQIVVRVLLP